MSNRQDFTIDNAILQEAIDALQDIPQKYADAIAEVKNATSPLLDKTNWCGEAREEFKDTYSIVEHYLEDDRERVSNIVDILKGFYDIYDATDIETVKSLVDKTGDVVDMLTSEEGK